MKDCNSRATTYSTCSTYTAVVRLPTTAAFLLHYFIMLCLWLMGHAINGSSPDHVTHVTDRNLLTHLTHDLQLIDPLSTLVVTGALSFYPMAFTISWSETDQVLCPVSWLIWSMIIRSAGLLWLRSSLNTPWSETSSKKSTLLNSKAECMTLINP